MPGVSRAVRQWEGSCKETIMCSFRMGFCLCVATRGLNEWEMSTKWITNDTPRTRDHSVKAARTGCGDSDRTPSSSLATILRMFIP